MEKEWRKRNKKKKTQHEDDVGELYLIGNI